MDTKKAQMMLIFVAKVVRKPMIPDKHTYAMRRRNYYLRNHLLFRNFSRFGNNPKIANANFIPIRYGPRPEVVSLC